MDSLRERADALAVLCGVMFQNFDFPTAEWAATFPTEVILYALVEAELKQRRTPDMSADQITDFASVVMRRRWREEQRRNGVALADIRPAFAAA